MWKLCAAYRKKDVHLSNILSTKSRTRHNLFSTNTQKNLVDMYISFFSIGKCNVELEFFGIFKTLDALTPIVLSCSKLLIQATPPTGVYLAPYQHSTARGLSYMSTVRLLGNMFLYLETFEYFFSLKLKKMKKNKINKKKNVGYFL